MKQSTPMKRSEMSRTPFARKAPMNRIAQRAPTKRPKRLKARKIAPTAAESVWMGQVAELGCIVCRQQGRGFVPCAVHHIVEGNRRVGHLFTIGLCQPGHHMDAPASSDQISRHPNKARFVAAYGSEYELLKITQEILRFKK